MANFHGYLPNVTEALILLEAATRGHFKINDKRLSSKEKRNILSGTTFINNEKKSGIKRWSDGITWSNSKLRKGFFVYFQIFKQKDTNHGIVDHEDALVKKTITIKSKDNQHYHIINYYKEKDIKYDNLITPSQYDFDDLEDIKLNLKNYEIGSYIKDKKTSSEDLPTSSSLLPPISKLFEMSTLPSNNHTSKQLTTEDKRQLDLINKYTSFN